MGEARNHQGYTDGYWWSGDGVRLHYRDYGGGEGRPPLICLPGLTRNARDFEGLAARLSPDWRVIVVEFRGRGESGYAKDPMSYVPISYLHDVERLLDELAIPRFIAVGTSLGGIVTMLLAAVDAPRVAAAVLNDVGPELEAAGLKRIRSYVGRGNWHPTWMHAARALMDSNVAVYPRYVIEDWLAMAKRLYRLNTAGRVVLDYDMKISEPFRLPADQGGPDMWRAVDALAGKPVLVVRGGHSDVLSARTAEMMTARLGAEAALVTVPDVGHAPTLDEPAAAAAIDALLDRVAREPSSV